MAAYKLTFTRNNKEFTREFEKRQDVLRYVVMNGIEDCEFKQLEGFVNPADGTNLIEGVEGLGEAILGIANMMDEADAYDPELEEAEDEEDTEEEDYEEDEEDTADDEDQEDEEEGEGRDFAKDLADLLKEIERI